MPRKLQAPGKAGARLHFDRTQVVHRHKDHVTVIPLDQVDHVEGGREGGPVLLPVTALVAFAVCAAAYWFRLLSPVVPERVWLGAGVVIAGALLGAYYMQSTAVVRIESARGHIVMRLPREEVGGTTDFVRHLLRTRTIFLEGVYEAEPVVQGAGQPTAPGTADEPAPGTPDATAPAATERDAVEEPADQGTAPGSTDQGATPTDAPARPAAHGDPGQQVEGQETASSDEE